MTAPTPRMLAPDPTFPQRDPLLDPGFVAGRLERALCPEGGELRIAAIERRRVTYRFGTSLRTLHRIRVGGEWQLVSSRSFAAGGAARAFAKASSQEWHTASVAGLPGFALDRELDTVFWVFPNDRRIGDLARVAAPDGTLTAERVPGWTRSEVVGYAPEKAATFRCTTRHGRTVAYAKVYGTDEGARTAAVQSGLVASLSPRPSPVELPEILGYEPEVRTLFQRPVVGVGLATLGEDELSGGFHMLGRAMAALHRLPAPPGVPAFDRLRGARLVEAAETVGRALPGCAGRAGRALTALLRAPAQAGDAAATLHGDLHPKNAVVTEGGLGLVDLDQVALGPAAADLGSVLAWVAHARCLGRFSRTAEQALTSALLLGYRDVAPPPDVEELGWFTAAALLAERAVRAVTRVRTLALANLEPLLGEAADLASGGRRIEP